MNFNQVIYGDIGHHVTDYLHLHPLAQFARCSKNTNAIVEYKYAHFKSLNLDDYMANRRDATSPSYYHEDSRFTCLCQKLKGIEVLQWSVNHPQLVCRKDAKKRIHPDSNALAQLYASLILGSASRLRVLRVYEAGSEKLTPTQVQEYHKAAILTLVNYLPRLEVLDVVRLAEDETGEVLLREKGIAERGRETLIEMMPNGIAKAMYFLPVPLLTPLQPHRLSRLRMLSSISLLLNQLRTLVPLMPQIEVATLRLVTTPSDFSQTTVVDEDESHYHNSSDEASSSLIFLRPGDRILLPLWSQLVFLSLHCDADTAIPDHTILEIRAHTLLGLNLSIDVPILDDVVLELPQAISINLSLTCILPTMDSEQHRGEDGSIDVAFLLPMPPSLIRSLRHSTSLRSLNVLPEKKAKSTNADWRDSLAQEERTRMDEKLTSLRVDQDQRENESTLSYRERLFLYALSALPCASTLEMISDSPQGVSLLEFVSLYPATRSFSIIPKVSNSTSITQDWRKDLAIGSVRIIEDQYLKSVHQRTKFEPDFVCEDYWQCADDGIEIDHAMRDLINRSGRFDYLTVLFLSTPTRVAASALTVIFMRCQQLRHVSLIQLVGVGNSVFMNLPVDCVRPALLTLRLKRECCHGFDQDIFDSSILETLMRVFPALANFAFIFPRDDDHLFSKMYERLTCLLEVLQLSTAASSTPSKSNLASFTGAKLLSSRALMRQCAIMNWPHLRILTLNRAITYRLPRSSASELALHQLLILRTRIQFQTAEAGEFALSSRELTHHTRELNLITLQATPTSSILNWVDSSRKVASDMKEPTTNSSDPIPRLLYHTEPCCQAHLCSIGAHREFARENATGEQ